MSLKFKFKFEELDNDRLRIDGKKTDSFFWWDEQRESIIIKKEWIPLIISTLRNTTFDDYNTPQTLVYEYANCNLTFKIPTIEKQWEYSYIQIHPIWKGEERMVSTLSIPYTFWNKTRLMSEFIEPFLVSLSRFLTEEERGRLPPPWPVDEKKINYQRPPLGDLISWAQVWLEGKDWYAGETDKSDDESIVAKIEKITKYQRRRIDSSQNREDNKISKQKNSECRF